MAAAQRCPRGVRGCMCVSSRVIIEARFGAIMKAMLSRQDQATWRELERLFD